MEIFILRIVAFVGRAEGKYFLIVAIKIDLENTLFVSCSFAQILLAKWPDVRLLHVTLFAFNENRYQRRLVQCHSM